MEVSSTKVNLQIWTYGRSQGKREESGSHLLGFVRSPRENI